MSNNQIYSASKEAKAILFDPENFNLASYLYADSFMDGLSFVASTSFIFAIGLFVSFLIFAGIFNDVELKSGKSLYEKVFSSIFKFYIIVVLFFIAGTSYYNSEIKPTSDKKSLESLSPLFTNDKIGSDLSLSNNLRGLLLSKGCLDLNSIIAANCHPTYVKFLMNYKLESDNKLSKQANPSNYLSVFADEIVTGKADFSEAVESLRKINSKKSIALEELVVGKLSKASLVEHTNIELLDGLQNSAEKLVDSCKSVSGLNCILFKKYFSKEVAKLNLSEEYSVSLAEALSGKKISTSKDETISEMSKLNNDFKLAVFKLSNRLAASEKKSN